VEIRDQGPVQQRLPLKIGATTGPRSFRLAGEIADGVHVVRRSLARSFEQGPKAKKFVAFAVDWPGWSRGAKTAGGALETLAAYRERYRPIAVRAGLTRPFDDARAGSRATEDDLIAKSPHTRRSRMMVWW
jgi:alkanesulfonate monooxygenase SsuD/methylene tetrahydromethanopterin reductase-like flavin-dependent oxidoreductase (luciferase family)